MIWEGQTVIARADLEVPDTFRHVRKSPLVHALASDQEILGRPIHLPVVRKLKNGKLKLIAGQKRVAGNDQRELKEFPVELVTCTDEEAQFIQDAENTHRLHNETKQDRERWTKSSLDLVARRRAMLEKARGVPVPKAEAVREVAKQKGIKPASVAQQNRRERRRKEKEALKAREVSGDEIASTTFDMPSADDQMHPTGKCSCAGEGTCEWCGRAALGVTAKWMATELAAAKANGYGEVPFTFDFLDTEEREDIRDYVSKVADCLNAVALFAEKAEAALRDCYALSGEDQNPDPQLQALDGYQTVLLQLKETALATIPRSICPACKGSDSACETCLGAIWVP